MKILFITTESFMDHSFTMIRELKKHTELDTFFIAKEKTEEIDNFCSTLNAKFFRRKRFLNPLNIISEFRLMKSIKNHCADVVWFNTLSLGQVFLVKFFLKRFLVSTHDIETHPEDEDYYYLVAKKITLWWFKKYIAVMSKTQALLFEEKYGLKPYLLQLPIIDYYGAVSEINQPSSEIKSKIRFLFFGSIQPYKGIEMLLDAADILNSKNIGFELNISGRLRYNTGQLTARISKMKNVVYRNEHIDYKSVYSVYLDNDVMVIPYKHVTQSGPLLICYSRNMPCIASNLPGLREYADDGKSGLIFNNTSEGLAEKMQEFIFNKGKVNEMSEYIKNEIHKKFSMESLLGNYLEVFKKFTSGFKI